MVMQRCDPFLPTLFNLILEKIVRKKNLTGKSTRLPKFSTYSTIMANRKAAIIKTIERLDRETRELGLQINESKTKYIGQVRRTHRCTINHIKSQI